MMDIEEQLTPSHLFTVRVWREELGGGRREWRGKVQHVVGGEAYYFRDWETLIKWLTVMLSSPDPADVTIKGERQASERDKGYP